LPFYDVFRVQSPAAQQSTFWAKTRSSENFNTVNTNLSPRVAISWDPWSNGKTKLAATAGRYYDKVVLGIPLIELEPGRAELAFDAQFDGAEWDVLGLSDSINPAIRVQSVDRDLATPYSDEFTLAFERELARETSGKVTYIVRRYRDQLQDIDRNHVPGDFGRCTLQLSPGQPTIVAVQPGDPDYDPAIGPGDGTTDDCVGKLVELRPGSGVFLNQPDGSADLYLQNPGWGDIYEVGNYNRIDYDALVFELTRRQYRNWELQASYTYSTAKGDGEDYAQSLGDDRSLIEDEKGYQSYDQRHVVKVSATTTTPWGFRFGGSASWQSGLPYSLLLRRPGYDAVPPPYLTLTNGTVRTRTTYPTGVRNDQRNDSYWDLNLKITREFRVARKMNLQLTAEVFNVLNDGTYQIFDPISETGEQINGSNVALRRFGRQWQLGARLAF